MRVPRVIIGAAALLLAAACSDAIAPTHAPERVPAVRPNAAISGGALVRSQLPAGRCMEVNGGTETASAGLPIAIWDCHGGDNQRWTLPATGTTGEIRAYDMCLDAWGAQGNDGDALVIWPCHGGSNQQWTVTAEGEIRAFNGKCADVWFALDENGATLKLYGCHGGPNQRWQP